MADPIHQFDFSPHGADIARREIDAPTGIHVAKAPRKGAHRPGRIDRRVAPGGC